MFKKLTMLAVVITLLVAACAPAATPAQKPAPPTEPAAEEPAAEEPAAPSGGVVKPTPGQALKMVFLPKNLGNAVFDEAHEGALAAAQELQYLAPASGAAGTEQIPIITNATT
jgi:rhamnose transport system substrate-binding protein